VIARGQLLAVALGTLRSSAYDGAAEMDDLRLDLVNTSAGTAARQSNRRAQNGVSPPSISTSLN